MSLNLVNSTVVIVAQQFNPSIIRDHWLISNEIVAEGGLKSGCVFTDVLVQARTDDFNLLVTPEQCQFSPLVEREEQQALIREKIGTIVQTLPHTPFTGIGINFHWHLQPEHSSIEQLTRRLFFVPDSDLHQRLDSAGARFGAYISSDSHGFRLKLDMKPALIMGSQENFIQLAFNFHLDLDLSGEQEDRIRQIEGALDRWEIVEEESRQLATLIGEGDCDD